MHDSHAAAPPWVGSRQLKPGSALSTQLVDSQNVAMRDAIPPAPPSLLVLVLVLVDGCKAAATMSTKVRLPPFSWDTVPVFAETSNVTGPFDQRALATLKRFPVFVGEKAYDYPGPGFAEDKLTALARHLRLLNPDIFLVFYYNANLDMDDYRLNAMSEAAAPTWWLRNSSGVPMVAPVDSGAGSRPPFPYAKNNLGGLHCWDHTNPAVREAWVQECLNMTASGGFDGCMVDRWTRNPFTHQPGYSEDYIVSHEAAQQESEALLLNRTREAGIWLVGEGEDVDATSFPGFFNGHTDQAIQQQMELASRGQGLMASYKPGSEGAAFTSTLAKFLIGGETPSSTVMPAIRSCLRTGLSRANVFESCWFRLCMQLESVTILGLGRGLATARRGRE